MAFRIVSDSSSNVLSMGDADYTTVPLKIIAQKEYVDDAALDLAGMMEDLRNHKGKSGSSCPGVADYLRAFEDGEQVFCFTVTSRLSGSYNAARLAKGDYEAAHPERKVFVMDTLSAGPELRLLLERAEEDIQKGMDFEDICRDLETYSQHTALMFSLEALRNLANNGRVSPVVAKLTGVLGIRVVGRASQEGTLEPLDKSRGEKKALQKLQANMEAMGYAGGKVRIDHCCNPAAAESLANALRERFADADVVVATARGLCSFYAEKGGLLVGFER